MSEIREQATSELTDGRGMLLPHARTFNALYNTFSRLYSSRFDEAVRHGQANADAMRRDAYFRSLEQERISPLARWKWEIEADPDETILLDSSSRNPKDPQSVEREKVRRLLEACVRRTHELHQMRYYLGSAVWYGRYGAQLRWDRQSVAGSPRWVVGWSDPVNGDKIYHDWDGVPGVMVRPGEVPSGYRVLTFDATGPVLMLDRPALRDRFVLHKHLVEDAGFMNPERAGARHGVGLRDFAYWAWWLRDEFLSWMTDFMQKAGSLGVWVFYYAEGNPESKAKAEQAARDLNGKNALAVPRPPVGIQQSAFEHIPVNMTGTQFLKEMIGDYFEGHIERLFVGQTLSSGTEGSGLGGSGVAGLHENTKFNLLAWDAENQAATLTQDLVRVAQKLNFPDCPWRYRWVYRLPDPEAPAKLDSVVKVAGLGVTFKADEIRNLTGMTKPDDGDEIVGGQQNDDCDCGESPSDSEGDEHQHYAAAHAPAGGVTIQGKRFDGGQFIPANVMAKASPEERASVEKPNNKSDTDGPQSDDSPVRRIVDSTGRARCFKNGKPVKCHLTGADNEHHVAIRELLQSGDEMTAEQLQKLHKHLQHLTVPEIKALQSDYLKQHTGKYKFQRVRSLVVHADREAQKRAAERQAKQDAETPTATVSDKQPVGPTAKPEPEPQKAPATAAPVDDHPAMSEYRNGSDKLRELIDLAAGNVRDPDNPERTPTAEELAKLAQTPKGRIDVARQLVSMWNEAHDPETRGGYTDEDRAALTRFMTTLLPDLKPIGSSGEMVSLDGEEHQSKAGGLFPGDSATVQMTGWKIEGPDGGRYVVQKAHVEVASKQAKATDPAPKSPTTGADNPPPVGNTPSVQPQSAGANQGGGTMDERTRNNIDQIAKQYPKLSADRVAEIAATIQAGNDTLNDPGSFHGAHETAVRASVETKFPTPDMPPLQAVSDAQRDFAVKVRAQKIASLYAKLRHLEQMAAGARLDGNDKWVEKFEQQQSDVAQWLTVLSKVTSAKRILDVKDNDLATTDKVVSKVIAQKLGVSL